MKSIKAALLASLLSLSSWASAGINLTQVAVEVVDWSQNRVVHYEDCTVRLLVTKYGRFGDRYAYFNCDSRDPDTGIPESSELDNGSRFVDVTVQNEDVLDEWRSCDMVKDVTDERFSGGLYNRRVITLECEHGLAPRFQHNGSR